LLNSILGRKFEIFPVELKENQVHCSTCGGTKWMIQDDKWLVQCKDCYDGTQKLCPICGKVVPRPQYQCEDCAHIREQQAEERRLDKAEKIEPDSEKALSFKMMYSEAIGDCENAYFGDWDDFFESFYNLEFEAGEKLPRPVYAWGTTERGLSLHADHVLENALDDFYEDASSDIGDKGYRALQDVLDKWVDEYGNITSYEVSYKCAIRIPWDQYDKQ
jgi:hypothetical protein